MKVLFFRVGQGRGRNIYNSRGFSVCSTLLPTCPKIPPPIFQQNTYLLLGKIIIIYDLRGLGEIIIPNIGSYRTKVTCIQILAANELPLSRAFMYSCILPSDPFRPRNENKLRNFKLHYIQKSYADGKDEQGKREQRSVPCLSPLVPLVSCLI